MVKNNTEAKAKTKRTIIDAKYEELEKKINEILDKIACKKIKTVTETGGFYQELLDFLKTKNIIIVKEENGNYSIKNGMRGRNTRPLDEKMVQGLKLLRYYTKQDNEESDIVDSIVDDMQKTINEEENPSKKYEILEVNNFIENPNAISVTVIDNSGNIIENVILPIIFTKFINQNPDYVNKIESQILFSLQDRLDGILNNLLKEIENEYKEKKETMSYRNRLFEEDYTQKEIIDDALEAVREKHKEFEQAIKNFKLVRKEDGIDLKCNNISLELPNNMVTKLQLLGFYDEKEYILVEKIMDEILHKLTISEFFHENDYLMPEDCNISKILTMGNLAIDEDNEETISTLDGMVVYVDQIQEEKMFKDKEERKKTTVILPYKFTKMVTQNHGDAFGTEKVILETINELFLQNTQRYEINSNVINKVLKERKIRLEKRIIDGKIQFVAKIGNQEILIDKKISQNILDYMKSEIKSVIISQYINNEEINEDDSQNKEESDEERKERKHFEYLLKTYKVLEKLDERGYIAKGISTGLIEKKRILEIFQFLYEITEELPHPNKIVLNLPYGIKEDLPEFNELFNEFIKIGRYVDISELLLMMEYIQNNEGHYSNFEKYKKTLININKMAKGKQTISKGIDSIINLVTNIPKRFTPKQTPIEFFMNSHLIPGLPQNDNDEIIVEIIDDNNNPIKRAKEINE